MSASSEPIVDAQGARSALSHAWKQVDDEQLAQALRRMPNKLRNRVLSMYRTPSSKVTATTARLLMTNLNRGSFSFHDRLRAADIITAPITQHLGEALGEAKGLAGEPDAVTEAFEDLAPDFGPSLVVLGVVAGMNSEPERFAPALMVLADQGQLAEPLVELAEEVRSCVEAKGVADDTPADDHDEDPASDPDDRLSPLREHWRQASEAVERITTAVRAGQPAAGQDMREVTDYSSMLATVAGELGVEPVLEIVSEAVTQHESHQVLAALSRRVLRVGGPDSLKAALRELHDAAGAISEDPTLADRMQRFLQIFDTDEPLERFSLASDLRAEPAPPAPVLIDAALAGLLTLDEPDAGDGAATHGWVGQEPEEVGSPDNGPPAAGIPLEEAPTGVEDGYQVAESEAQSPEASSDEQARTDQRPLVADGPTPAAQSGITGEPPLVNASAVTEGPGMTAGPETRSGDRIARGAADNLPADAKAANTAGAEVDTATADTAAPGTEAAPLLSSESRRDTTKDEAAPTTSVDRGEGTDTATEHFRDQTDDQASGTPAAEEPSPEQITTTLTELVAARRFGLAYHLATALGQDYRAGILAEAALAQAVRSTASASATEMLNRSANVRVNVADPGSVVLRVAAVTRTALLDPSSGAPAVLRQLMPDLTDLPRLRDFVVAVASATEKNLIVPATGMFADIAESDAQAQAIASWAEDTLRRPPRQNRLYRGVEIWKQWMAPNGLLGSILAAVATNDASRVVEVREACLPLADRRLRENVVDDADKSLREGRRAERIVGPAREHLVRGIEEIVEQALLWCESHPAARGGQADELREQLATQAVRLRGNIDDEVAAVAMDEWSQAASTAARSMLAETIGLLGSEPLKGAGLTPNEALNRGLALVAEVALDAELGVRDTPTPAQLAAAASVSRSDAFTSRLHAGDFTAAEAIVDLGVGPGDGFDETAARQELRICERDELANIQGLWNALDSRFAAARSRGHISDADAARLQGMLLQAQPRSAESGVRRDLGRVGAELEALAVALEEAATLRRHAVRADIDDAIAAGELDKAWSPKLEDLLDRDELGAAEEYLHRARAGEAPPEGAETTSTPDTVLPDVLDAGTGVTSEVVAAVRAGAVHAGLDFSSVTEIDRESVATALEAWLSLSGPDRPADLEAAMGPVLRLLGLIPTSVERPPQLRRISTKGHWFVDVHGDRSGYAYVPDFGSRSAGRRRFMLCWDDLPMSQLWNLAATNAPADQPAYVLRLGLLGSQARIELARHARRSDGERVVVIDDAVILRCALAGRQAFDVTMRTVLPYASSNPYNPDLLAGTPEEMFYGRSAERHKISAPAGSSFISGGRRLGKTALLRSVQSELEGTDVLALLIVIQHVAAVPPSDPAELWPLLAARLIEAGVLPSGTEGSADAVSAGIRAWLADNPSRRLLLLLDECDFFLRADAASSFANVVRLRDLMQYGGGRFKVVFSGLQHVARYRKLPNQPLSHLPQPLVIGPLDAASAAALVRRPLHALGWSISDTQVDRLVTFCACNPSVIQLAGGQLLERLRAESVEELAPWPVPEEVLSELLRSPEVDQGVRDRLFLTLELDHRYKLLAHLLAWRAVTEDLGTAASPADLRRQAVEYWPEGFSGQNPDDVRTLCDELVGLGVFAGDAEAGYRMLSPATVRLFGPADEIAEELISASGNYEPNVTAGAAGNRMALGEGRYSPLTATQLADVVGAGSTQLRVVVGSRALRADAVAEALAAASRRLPGVTTNELTGTSRRRWRDSMSAPQEGHVVVVSDMTVGRSRDSWEQSIDAARRRGQARTAKGTRSAVLVAGPSERWLLRQVVSTTDGRRGSLADVAVGLRRIDLVSLRAWDRIEELDLVHPARQARLLEVTGGWPLLVEQAIARMRQCPFDDALDEMEAHLGTIEGARELVAAVGLDPEDPDQPADPGMAACFARLATTGFQDTPADLAGLLGIDDELEGEDDPPEALAIMAMLSMLDEDEEGLVRAEPVLAACACLALPTPPSV